MKNHPVLIGVLIALASSCGAATWSESMVSALAKKNRAEEKALMAQLPSGEKIALAFAKVAIGMRAQADGEKTLARFATSFEGRLARGLKESTFQSYAQALTDTAVPEAARQILLRTLAVSGRRLEPAWPSFQNRLFPVLKGLLDPREPSLELKASALRQLGRVSIPKSDSVLLLFAASPDSLLRNAAYDGLGRKVVGNKHAYNRAENAVLFEGLLRLSANGLSPEQLKIFVLMDEPYAMNHLAAKSSADTEGPIQALLKGSDWEVETGLRLLAIFPDLIDDFEPVIRARLNSRNQSVRQAAQALATSLEPSVGEGK